MNDAKLDRAKRFVLDGPFRPKVARTFSFDEIVEARRYLESNAQVGKVVVTV